MENVKITNPNDQKVVSFHNSTEFGFTPDMGCMYDGRPINGVNGSPGIDAGEKIMLPYHVAHRLATNLAKVVMMRQAPEIDPAGIPTGVPLWDTVKLENLKNSFLTDLYSEAKPITMSETDRLMAKVEELKKFVEQNVTQKDAIDAPAETKPAEVTDEKKVYMDKAEVIAELTKRDIKFDARKKKEDLEKLLA